ncbi:lipoprotein [Deltaproteobacteria bacterium]|nr:lipoprotein [Deltaproteobacteria bacterium]
MQNWRTSNPAVILVLCFTLLAGGCAATGGKVYSKGEARTAQTVERGVIKTIDKVSIEQDAGILGTALGGTAGGVIGSTMGKGAGRILMTVAGAAVGAIAGAFGEKAVRSENAYEFLIKRDNGSEISIVQAIDGDYRVGDRVRILHGSDNRARVVLDR